MAVAPQNLQVPYLQDMVNKWQQNWDNLMVSQARGRTPPGSTMTFTRSQLDRYKAQLAQAQKNVAAGQAKSAQPQAKSSGGGGGGGGGTTVAPSGISSSMSGTTSPQSEADIEDLARSQYGFLSAYLDNPEIGPILKQGAKEGWDMNRLQGALYKTKWWKKTSDTARQWDALVQRDPASSKQQVKTKQAEIWDTARGLGYSNISTSIAKQFATQALREGWSQAQIIDHLAAEIRYNGPLSGLAGQTEVQLKRMASGYLANLSPDVLHKKIQRVVAGESTVEDFRNEMIKQAKALAPWASESLDKGQTLDEIADPYRQLYSQTLGVDPSTVSFKDPKFMKAISFKDPKTGVTRPMQFDEWTSHIKTNPTYGYDTSRQGVQDAAAFRQQLQQKFGFAA